MTNSRTDSRNRLVCWLSSVVLTVLWPLAAIAQALPKADFDIPPQRLEAALQQVAQVQRVQILFNENDVKGLASPGVKGRLSTYEAVQKLIEGTGLSAVANQNNAIAIKPKSANEKRGQAANPTILAQAQSAERPGAVPTRANTNSDQKAVRGEDIVVTARKRDERLIDVPMSIAVVTKDEIDQRGLVNAEDYLRGIPGVNQASSGYGGQIIVMRGLETTTTFQNFASGPTTATYFGETPTTNSGGLNGSNIDIKLVDIERVEALRGPQGTAFGNSSLGGAVRVIPVAPRLDRFEGHVASGYSATSGTGGDNYNVQGMLNIPLVKDTVALRAVAYQYHDSGFYRNRAGSDATFNSTFVIPFGLQAFVGDQENVGAYDVAGARVAALWRASDDLKFTFTYLTQKTETNGWALQTNGRYEQTLFGVAPEHLLRGQKGGLSDDSIDLANAVMEYDLGWADLLATYSRTKSKATQAMPYRIFNIPWAVSEGREFVHREDSGEIRLATKLNGAWNFLAGFYAESHDDDRHINTLWHGDPATNVLGAGQRFVNDARDLRDLKQKAAFGEVSWEFLPAFTLTGGGRAYAYERTIRLDQRGLFGNVNSRLDSDESGSIYRANLSYKAGDYGLLHAGWSQGFRLGKPQPAPPAVICDTDGNGIIDGTNISLESAGRLKSDTVDSYELGAKFATLDRRLRIDATLFRMNWLDIPILQRLPCPQSTIINAGDARSEGVELQMNLQVSESFRVDIGGSWINARLVEDVPALGASKGARLPGAPKVNANLSLQYKFNVGGYNAFVRADSIYVGPFYGNLAQTASLRAGDYVKLDITARCMIGRALTVDIYAHNVTNEDGFTFRGSSPSLTDTFGFRLRPRTIGFQFGYTF